MPPTFFKSRAEFRNWLEANHAKVSELLVGFHKKDSGKASITYPEALNEALCFGWIDGVRKGFNETSYTVRFSPRRPKSGWSEVNTRRVAELKKLGLMARPGLEAFENRDEQRSKQYSFENRAQPLDPALEKQFRANRKAWDFFQAQPPGYRRVITWWIMSAKKDETRLKRLATLIEGSERGKRIGETSGKK